MRIYRIEKKSKDGTVRFVSLFYDGVGYRVEWEKRHSCGVFTSRNYDEAINYGAQVAYSLSL